MLKDLIADLGLDRLDWEETLTEAEDIELNIPEKAGTGVAKLADSDEFGKYYAYLTENPALEPVEDLDELNLFNSSFTWKCHYEDGNLYTINLRADFEHDNYELEIDKREEEDEETSKK